jgi:beta-ureidopropionase / N-carbamoyl-L-amino-acid hydrolase
VTPCCMYARWTVGTLTENLSGNGFQVDPVRIRKNLQDFAAIGYRPNAGMSRLAFSRADLRARQVLIHKLGMLGLESRVDAFGTVFGRLSTEENDSCPPVLVGSHLDAVPGGGRFDGSIGVAAGLEVAAVMREHIDRAHVPLEVVSFSCEESSRFGRGTLASGIMAGTWQAADILDLTDAQGRSLANVLRRVGLDPDLVDSARRQPGDFTAFIELHIEQGRVLEESGVAVGIVDIIAAPTRFRLSLSGQADHSGATPMSLRRDALTGAAEVILAVERLANSAAGVVGTVGTVRVDPDAINVVPGRVDLGIDIRSTVSSDKRHVVDHLLAEVEQIAGRRGLTSSLNLLTDEEPVVLDRRVIDVLAKSAAKRSISSSVMPSGAGHDAMHVAALCPTGMVLAPSVGGISHHHQEWTEMEDIVTAIQVVVDAAIEMMLHGI